ncbi:MAG: Rrf2 family transcriptional regulator [Rhodospirillales bacterium]
MVTKMVIIMGKVGFVRLSTRGRYAVMAMVDLAGYGDGLPKALSDIAQRQVISLSYLEQIFAQLRQNGLVESVRGPGGGYLLARPPTETAIADIMMAVNDPARKARPVPARPKAAAGSVTESLWEEVDNRIYLFLNSVTLADVCEKRVLGLSGMMHQKVADAPAAGLPTGNSGGDDGVKPKPRARARARR